MSPSLIGRCGGSSGGGGGFTSLSDTTLAADGLMTVSSIPQTHDHLFLILTVRTLVASSVTAIHFLANGDVGAHYSYGEASMQAGVFSGGTFNAKAQGEAGNAPGSTEPAGEWGVIEGWIYSYADAAKFKLMRFIAQTFAAVRTDIYQNTWSQAAALTSLSFFSSAPNLAAGTRLQIWGV